MLKTANSIKLYLECELAELHEGITDPKTDQQTRENMINSEGVIQTILGGIQCQNDNYIINKWIKYFTGNKIVMRK